MSDKVKHACPTTEDNKDSELQTTKGVPKRAAEELSRATGSDQA